MNTLQRFITLVGGTTATGALEAGGGDHPLTLIAAASTALFALVSTYYKIKNKGK